MLMEAEIVAVPSRGIERWLTQQLSGRLGTTARPGRRRVRQRRLPVSGDPGRAGPRRRVGRRSGHRPLAPGAVGVAADRRGGRLPRRAVARSARCSSAQRRPSGRGAAGSPPSATSPTSTTATACTDRRCCGSWAAGEDQGTAPDSRWQAELWRRLRERIGTPSPAERLGDACTRLREDAALVDLPERFSLFGLTRLPASYLDVLTALAAGRDVHLFLLHPSPALWDDAGRATEPRGACDVPDDPTAEQTVEPAARLVGSRRPGDAAGARRHR